MKKPHHCVCVALCLVLWAGTALAALPQDLPPGLNADVVERLPERVSAAPATPQAAAATAPDATTKPVIVASWADGVFNSTR